MFSAPNTSRYSIFCAAVSITATPRSPLVPTAKRLPTTLRDVSTVVKGAAVLPLNKIPAFENAVLPLAGQLGPIATGLTQALPPLTSSFKVLSYLGNEIGFALQDADVGGHPDIMSRDEFEGEGGVSDSAAR